MAKHKEDPQANYPEKCCRYILFIINEFGTRKFQALIDYYVDYTSIRSVKTSLIFQCICCYGRRFECFYGGGSSSVVAIKHNCNVQPPMLQMRKCKVNRHDSYAVYCLDNVVCEDVLLNHAT